MTTTETALYAFSVTAQQWRTDPYFIASSAPVHKLTVVAADKQGAIDEAARVVGPAAAYHYWRFWVHSSKDIRLMTEAEKAAL